MNQNISFVIKEIKELEKKSGVIKFEKLYFNVMVKHGLKISEIDLIFNNLINENRIIKYNNKEFSLLPE